LRRLPGRAAPARPATALARGRNNPAANPAWHSRRCRALQRTGRLVDVGGDVVEQTFVRISALGLQSGLDRDLVDHLGDGYAALRHLRAHALHVPFTQIEPYPDRVELDDGRELARVVAADEFADRYLARSHDPVEGSRNRGVAEIDLRRLHI